MESRINSKGRLIIVTVCVVLAVVALLVALLPSMLHLVPSRYLALLPAPIESLRYSEATPILPTAQAPADIAGLLNPVAVVAPTATATPTPEPAVVEGTGETPTPPPTLAPTATAATVLVSASRSQRLDGFRHEFQGWNNCGPTTVAMALSYFDLNVSQEDTAAVLKPSPEDRNVSPHEMADYVNNETSFQAISRANGDLDMLRLFLSNEIPVIVEIGLDPPGEYAWLEWYGHYLLVVAYDDDLGEIWTYDSWFGTSAIPGENETTAGRKVSYENLETYWQQFNYSYIALYRPEQAEIVAQILGDDMDDEAMYGRALAETQAQLNAEQENAFLWFNLGTNYSALSDYQRAAAAFDRAREIGLPWRMLWYQFEPFEAYYQTGRYEEVVQLAELTLADRPYLEEMLYYQGLAQAALGDVNEARAKLNAAYAFNPNFTLAAVALSNLDASN